MKLIYIAMFSSGISVFSSLSWAIDLQSGDMLTAKHGVNHIVMMAYPDISGVSSSALDSALVNV